MPIYDFHCPGCNWEGEASCTIAERDLITHCPQCGGEVKRVVTKVPLQTFTDRERAWGTSHVTSSSDYGKKRREKEKRRLTLIKGGGE